MTERKFNVGDRVIIARLVASSCGGKANLIGVQTKIASTCENSNWPYCLEGERDYYWSDDELERIETNVIEGHVRSIYNANKDFVDVKIGESFVSKVFEDIEDGANVRITIERLPAIDTKEVE